MGFEFEPNVGEITFAILGGILISIATSLFIIMKGRTCSGFSSFIGLITMNEKTRQWNLSFYCGLIFIVTLFFQIFKFRVMPCLLNVQFFELPIRLVENNGLFGYLIGGFFIGFGA